MMDIIIEKLVMIIGCTFAIFLPHILQQDIDSLADAYVYTCMFICFVIYLCVSYEMEQNFKNTLKLKSKYYDSYVRTGRF